MSGRSRSLSASAEPASTISRTSASKFPTTPLPSSPASAAPENPRSPSTPFTRKASAATSNRSPPTPGNFSSAWKSRMWTKSRGSPGRRFYVLHQFRVATSTAGVAVSKRGARKTATAPPPELLRQALLDMQKRGFNRLYQAGRLHEFSSPETLLDVDFSKPVYILVH